MFRELGSQSAPIVIEEFSSLTCSHCARFHNEFYAKLKKDYVETGKVRIIFRNFPLDNVAMSAALLALSIPKDRYFKFVNYMYFYQAELSKSPYDTLVKWAKQSGVTQDELGSILQNEKLLKAVNDDMEKINRDYAINGTPLIIVDGKRYEGVPNKKEFFSAIDKLYETKK